MISTFLGYQLYAHDLTKSLQRVDAEPVVKTSKGYFDAHIGTVKSVDDLIGNYRLFSYVMKAYGLEDMTYAKGLMRQVLTSDLSDASSVANKLSDSRYRAIAQAFNFTTSGAVAPTSIQSAAQQSATVAQFQAATAGTLDAKVASDATSYYQSHIGTVTSVAALEKDQKLSSYVMAAYGLDPTTSATTIAAVLESDIADPAGLLNKTPGAGYAALKQAVNVSASGGASTVVQKAQSQDAILATATAYTAGTKTDTASRATAKAETTYYASAILKVTSVDDLLKDNRLVAYMVQAFDLPSTTSATTLRQVLTSDPSQPSSVVNQLSNPNYKALAVAFNFEADGTLKTLPFQDAGQQQATVALYTARQKADSAAVDSATQYYKAHIGTVKTVADLEHDPKLYHYILTAYGVAPTTAQGTVEQVMEQSLTDATAVVNTTAGSRYLALAAAFSVNAQGSATDALQAQTADAVTTTTTAYLNAAASDAISQKAAKVETAYYKAAIPKVTSVGDLLGDSRLVAYARKAFGIPASASTDQLRAVLTSDLTASGSTANVLGPQYKQMAAAFTFTTTGLIAHQPVQTAQTASQKAATDQSYDRQVMENEAGDQNTGIKLALYFQRMAPTITSAYGILADKAVYQVFQTMLNLPAASAKADIDVQAKYLASRVNFADLKDPVKLGKMVQRFAAMYDMANPDSDATNRIAMLFGSKSS